MVARYRFGRDDLLRTRFAIAPLMDLSLLDVAAPLGRRGYWPVFVAPPPQVPHAKIATELDRIRATPPQQVKAEIMRTYPDGRVAARPFAGNPADTLADLVGQMDAFWKAALAPWWTRMSAVLESEIASRARSCARPGWSPVAGKDAR